MATSNSTSTPDDDDRQPYVHLGVPWDDQAAEHEFLTSILLPAIEVRQQRTLDDWDALDTKALGMVALAAAVVAGLAATHDSLNRFWALPALGFVAAACLMVVAIWPRQDVELGADLVDLHDKMRSRPSIEASRTMFDLTSEAEDDTAADLEGKTAWFRVALVLFAISVIAVLPIIVFRP